MRCLRRGSGPLRGARGAVLHLAERVGRRFLRRSSPPPQAACRASIGEVPIIGTAHEVLHNVLSHAEASRTAQPAALISAAPAKSPPGRDRRRWGRHRRHHSPPPPTCLAWLVLGRAGHRETIADTTHVRGADTGEEQGGGGLAADSTLSEHDGVILRSGSAFITLRGPESRPLPPLPSHLRNRYAVPAGTASLFVAQRQHLALRTSVLCTSALTGRDDSAYTQ